MPPTSSATRKTSSAPARRAPARQPAAPVTAPGSGKAPKRGKEAKETKGAKETREVKRPRPKLVRDSFTMPEADFSLIATLKATALAARRAAKKSELLRAGLRALALLDGKALAAALDRLEPVKTGRPKKGHGAG